tara:strand:- start:647 stop:922 length:276 start_codon:yes stop_codon:yes gene_type:complete
MNNISEWLNRADYTAEERRNICAQLLSEAQYWDVHQYLKMMHDSTKRPWVGLTVDEILSALESVDPETKRLPKGFADFAYAVEAKLKEKNT